MLRLFEQSRSVWVRYSEYVWKEDGDGMLFLIAAPDAVPDFIDPIEDYEQIVINAVNTGLICMNSEKSTEDRKEAIYNFVKTYGLLGIMTALPTTVHFLEYENVYFPVNQFIKEESMPAEDYLDMFFPFEKPDIVRRKGEVSWTTSSDNTMKALAMSMDDRVIPVNLSLQRNYAERYYWLEKQFKEWAFLLLTVTMHYSGTDGLSEDEKLLYKQSVRAFEGVAPVYRLELYDRPTIVWEFNSLMQAMQLMISIMLSDDNKPVKICK